MAQDEVTERDRGEDSEGTDERNWRRLEDKAVQGLVVILKAPPPPLFFFWQRRPGWY
jgi:hypothetical protein